MAYNRTIMHPKFHADILRRALSEQFSARALEKIIEANIYQDRLAGQYGHDEFHFDNNSFDKSYAYIEEQRALVVSSLKGNDVSSAWSAFGRLTHTAQDFYAHSNYVDLWLSIQPDGAVPTMSEMDPVDADLIHSQALRSGKLYLPLELFSFVKLFKPLVMPLLPRHSHAWMNLDTPEQGPNFDFALHAAVKRTRIEFERTIEGLSQDLVAVFVNK